MTISLESTAAGGDVAEALALADAAFERGDFGAAVELYERAAPPELPGADICLKIARCHEKLGDPEAAFPWLVRATEASDAFMSWNSAASLLRRLTLQARPQARRTCSAALTGSYTTNQLAAILPLAALRHGIDLSLHEGLFAQYQQDLIDPRSALYAAEPEQIVLAVHEGAVALPAHSDSPESDVESELGRWQGLWRAAAERCGAGIVQHNFAVRPEAPHGHLTPGVPGARRTMIEQLNKSMAATAPGGVSLVDCDALAASFGRNRWFDDRYWIRSKQAVALEALPLLARHTAAVLAARLGLTRKCLVLDLDNTLWGGIIGEEGIDGIRLGPEGVGEAFLAFQDYILELKDRGVILAVASKNNPDDARQVFERHPAMRIRLDDLAMFAVNWDDKPANLRRIAETLDIGLDSLVFVDDNPAERVVVRKLVPEVDVPVLPREPAGYRRALAEYLGFEAATVTAEDRKRTDQYRARAAAKELAHAASDLTGFYRDLEMTAVVAPFDEAHLPRIVQLIGKTNQFNLTTRRHGQPQVEEFMASPRHVTRYLKLSDRLADHGLVALAIAEQQGSTLDIDTLLMSCRVIGRTVEAELLAELCDAARERGCTKLRGTFIATAKNGVVADLFERFGFRALESSPEQSVWEYDIAASGPIRNEFIDRARPT